MEKLIAVPAASTPYEASFAEPVAIGVQACRRGGIGPEDRVLVLGAGPIGLAVIEVARARGASVWATDLTAAASPPRSSSAPPRSPPGPELAEAVAALTGGEGMPVVVEAAGAVPAMEAAFDLVAPGGRVVILGLARKGVARRSRRST